MRKFDNNGLLLVTFQAKLFEESVSQRDYSSLFFLRRFKYSQAARDLDNKNPSLIDLNRFIFLQRIDEEYNDTDCSGEKYDKAVMFWLGYIYRYICYTRECSTKFVFNLIPPSELKKHFNVYHTQSEEWVIKQILDLKGWDENIFDKNERIKKRLLEMGYNQQSF